MMTYEDGWLSVCVCAELFTVAGCEQLRLIVPIYLYLAVTFWRLLGLVLQVFV